MKVECNIDGKALSLSVNSNKPLSLILMEDLENLSLTSHCRGRACGNCIVLVNDEATLSCLVPAFRIRDAKIKTFERYQRSAQYRDIERAYKAFGSAPCSNCYNAKTLIIESILNQIIGDGRPRNTSPLAKDEPLDKDAIIQELSLNTCQCIGMGELLQIVELALTHRRRRLRVRRR
jgi:aerobic-type carbon monoxide dehydrogenase small subunit (CoxS/CutS family)